ncbi:MAG: DUF4147 domain-containing protein [Mariniblastus sp.]|nr:DUF4147 domain-containing protein [Mariniblastus sp.]
MKQMQSLRDDAIAIWREGVNSVNAEVLVKNAVAVSDNEISVGTQRISVTHIERILCVGFGKASAAMAVGLEKVLADIPLPLFGLVSVPDDQIVETEHIQIVGTRPAGENLPTPRVLEVTRDIIELVQSAGPKDLIVCLISGGGSALLELPLNIDGAATSITLNDIIRTTQFLSSSGASIHELNAVRQRISRVKGGSLAAVAGGARFISLIISDVVGDPLEVIASGPTIEPSNNWNAIDVLRKFDPHQKNLPWSVWQTVESQLKPEVKFSEKLQVDNIVIGNIELAMQAACNKARELGYNCNLENPSGNEGDAQVVGRQVASQILELQDLQGRQCLIQGGETTVQLCNDPGQGGRNQHLVLSTLDELIRCNQRLIGEFCLLSGGTDGEDGTVPVAGAIIDDSTLKRLWGSNADEIRIALARCNSFNFHQAHQTLLATQKTSTNVCDLRVLLTSNPVAKTI